MSKVTERPSGRLMAKLRPLVAEVAVRSKLMAEHPNSRGMYWALIELLHAEVRASVPLMVAAERRAVKLAGSGDIVAEALAPWLQEHIADETDYDTWLLADYARIGGDPDSLADRPGSPTVAAMVGSVYYWTLHAHPVAILGYCAVLEGTPPTSAFIEEVVARTGYPPNAFHTLYQHCQIDVNHAGELLHLIDSLPLSQRHEGIIGLTALQTADLLIGAGDELLDVLQNHR